MNTKKVNWIMGVSYAIFMLVLMLILGVTKSFSQTTDPIVTFRYDGCESPLDAPAAVPTVEQLKEQAIDRKMQQHNPKGLPSMEEIKKNPIEIIIGKIQLHELPKLGSIKEDVSLFLVHLIKDDTKDTANLINEDWNGSHNG